MGCAPTKAQRYGDELSRRVVCGEEADGAITPRHPAKYVNAGAEQRRQEAMMTRSLEGQPRATRGHLSGATKGRGPREYMQYMPEVGTAL